MLISPQVIDVTVDGGGFFLIFINLDLNWGKTSWNEILKYKQNYRKCK